jgi:hypothetical protein
LTRIIGIILNRLSQPILRPAQKMKIGMKIGIAMMMKPGKEKLLD